MTASTRHQTKVKVTAIQGNPGAEIFRATVLMSLKGTKRMSWMKSQTPTTRTRISPKSEFTNTKRNRKKPPQKAKIDLPRSHQVTRKALKKSVRLCRMITERTQRMLTQRLAMIAPTGSSKKTLLAAMSHQGSLAPQAKAI